MKKWIFFVLAAIFLNCPVLAGADDTPDAGRNTMFNYPLFTMPLGKPDYKNDKKEEGETAEQKKQREKQMTDKKIDDAIKKAWEEK